MNDSQSPEESVADSKLPADEVAENIGQEALPVAVAIVAWKDPDALGSLLLSLEESMAVGGRTHETLVVNNGNCPDVSSLLEAKHRHIVEIRSKANSGYAGGGALALNWVRENRPDAGYLAVLNQDLIVAPRWLDPLVEFLVATPDAACTQPLVLHQDQQDRVNTAGNQIQFLGFGVVTHFGRKSEEISHEPVQIGFASGACAVAQLDLLNEIGLFDERLFLYHEDTDLGWRLQLRGLKSWLVPQSHVFHDYAEDSWSRHYRWLERNRLVLLLTLYRRRTFLLLSPLILAMELAQWFFCLAHGLAGERLAAWRDLLRSENRRWLSERRRLIQTSRSVSDRALAQGFVGPIKTPGLQQGLLLRVANPLLAVTWGLLRNLIFW